ncbi:MAG: glucosamine-6-phosphate isomerase [Pirellulaceae bacterium]|nr:glucosamine-6-phosphate isomerase [Pirellulaceae bacterium]
MTASFPTYLSVSRDELGQGTGVQVRVVGDMAALARDMARHMFDKIVTAQGTPLTIIAPVGPVDQYPLLAEMIQQQSLDCQHLLMINMDEYLTEDDSWISKDHPLSFRGYMDRKFYDLLSPSLAPPPENRIFPDPQHPDRIQQIIDERGGVDVTYGGIGINAHLAFNEPEGDVSLEEFASRPTRLLNLSPHTRTINANTVGGDIQVIPERAITVGMCEILQSKELQFYCNRPWQSAVVRRLLHGPITAACPASLLRTHANTTLTIADYVAELPDIRLR